MPSLTQRVQAASFRKYPECHVATAKTLVPDLADELETLTADRTLFASAIAREFTALLRDLRPDVAFTLGEHSISRHRRGDCSCRS